MIGRIDTLARDKTTTYEDLDPFIKDFFLKKARQIHKKEYGDD